MQGQVHGAARFKITKPSFHSRYECKPDNAPDGPSAYSLEISKNPKKHPDLALTLGGSSVAACYFPEASRYYNSDSKTFRIGIGDPANGPNGQIMAVFSSHTMSLRPSSVGTLQINMDLGPMFEYAVITTLLSIYDFQKREEEKRSSSSSAGGAAAAAASG
ncbi:hypothetical protein Neosp_002891 [[Neocosmospora] mangrovei]